MLERRIVDLGLGEHVELDDRFLSVEELADLLAATDVFVTPYTNREQSSSGALTFALAAGCAVVSTPYLVRAGSARARVPERSSSSAIPPALGAAVCDYIEAPETACRRARGSARIGGSFGWPAIGGGDRGRAARGRRRGAAPHTHPGRRRSSSPMSAPTIC